MKMNDLVEASKITSTLRSRTAKKTDCSIGPLARPFAHTAQSLAHFAHSLARGKVNYKMAILSVFFFIVDHSAVQAK